MFLVTWNEFTGGILVVTFNTGRNWKSVGNARGILVKEKSAAKLVEKLFVGIV